MKADHKQVKKLLNMAKGQIEGILKMIDEDRYCIDISTQMMAAGAILKKANKAVLTAHLESCVLESMSSDGAEKINEIITIIDKLN
jgi:CsoR family transcriptional regulator, copper-sensing transcriptional repressor